GAENARRQTVRGHWLPAQAARHLHRHRLRRDRAELLHSPLHPRRPCRRPGPSARTADRCADDHRTGPGTVLAVRRPEPEPRPAVLHLRLRRAALGLLVLGTAVPYTGLPSNNQGNAVDDLPRWYHHD